MRFADARAQLIADRSDRDAAVRDFVWPDVSGFNWAFDWFDAVLARDPSSVDRDALIIVDTDTGREERASFGTLRDRSNRVAQALLSHGIARGDRILVVLGNVLPLWEIMLAALKVGAVVIPATPMLTGEELRDRLDRGGAKLVIAADDQVAKFDGLGNAGLRKMVVGSPSAGWDHYDDVATRAPATSPATVTDPADPFLLYFTSGTTAQPKLVVHSQASYPVGSLSTMYWLGLRPGDHHLNISSPGWAKHAWSSVFAPWNAGATIVVLNQPRFSARVLIEALARYRIDSLCAPPTVWRMVVQEPLGERPSSLRELCSAGEPLNAEIIDQIEKAWGLTIRDGYGQTESTAQIGNSPGQRVKAGTMGRPLPGYTLSLRDADGAIVDEGELCVELGDDRPLGLMQGYLGEDGRPQGTDAAFYRTGDVAFRDADGYFTFVGRADDVFKSSDYRISPFELESALIEHPHVVEAAVVPAPDELRLSVPKAYVLLVAGVQPSQTTALALFDHLSGRLAPYKRIRRIEFIDEFPKTISGKIRRVQLRRQEVESAREGSRRAGEFRDNDPHSGAPSKSDATPSETETT